jgi:DNA-binding XRE family transcriptional regulator
MSASAAKSHDPCKAFLESRSRIFLRGELALAWEIRITDGVEAFLDELYESDRETHRLVNDAIQVLEDNGPMEGRPLVDSLVGSTVSNLKELRLRPGVVLKSECSSASIRGGRRFCSSPVTRRASGSAGTRKRFRGPSGSMPCTWMSVKGRLQMDGVKRWRDTLHRDLAVETAGGEAAFSEGVRKLLDESRGWRLAEMRLKRSMTQADVASQMGISVARVSQIEAGDVSTQDVLRRYIAALGGTLHLVADFGDEQLKVS